MKQKDHQPAIEGVGLSYQRFVPRRFRSKEDMIGKLKEYTLKWFGFGIKVLPSGKVEIYLQDWEEVELKLVRLLHLSCTGKRWKRALSDSSTATRRSGSRLPKHNLARAKGSAQDVACDGKILGKRGIQQEVLNLAKHIHKGCFNFFLF